MMKIRQDEPFKYGYNVITTMDENVNNTMMDFGILKLARGQAETDTEQKERAFLLIKGEVILEWENMKETVQRNSFFDENPWVLHVPKGLEVNLTGVADGTEICVIKTVNDQMFTPRLYNNEECASEDRGKGTMKEASTRVVRTVFDYSNAKHSNLVLGEVINYPGKWSSFPPHYHPQPEIYFYKFNRENGFGFCQLGDEAVQVKHNDTVKIFDVTHSQVTAPGYAMYYVWVIRHLDGNPYITPVFEPEHIWSSEKDAKIWPDK